MVFNDQNYSSTRIIILLFLLALELRMEVIVVVAARSSSLMIPTALGAWEGGDGLGFFDCMLSTTRQVFYFLFLDLIHLLQPNV